MVMLMHKYAANYADIYGNDINSEKTIQTFVAGFQRVSLYVGIVKSSFKPLSAKVAFELA